MNTAQLDLDEYLKPAEVATIVRLSVATLATMRCEGRGPAYTKLGNAKNSRVRYRRGDVLDWIGNGSQATG